MNNNEINFLIGILTMICLCIFLLVNGRYIAESNCNEVFENNYQFVVLKKIKEKMNHGQLKLKCRDIENDSIFIFYPDAIMPYNLIYDKVARGDTIIKSKKSSLFLIFNKEKKDTFRFNCE